MNDIHFGALTPQGWKGEFDGMDGSTAYRTMIDIAGEIERHGFDSVWLYDHFHAVPPPARPTPVFECWTSMMALAAYTQTIRLGQMVTCTPYRNAAYLAKVAACVDVASDGRVEVGVGAGWHFEEFEAYGYGFPSPGERIGYLDDTCEILVRMWRDDAATFEGRYASVKGAYCDPKPLQRPRPPLWIGGGGERKTLRVVARHADYWNVGGPVDNFARKSDILQQHCDDVGRDYGSIVRTLHHEALLAPTERELANLLGEYPSIWGADDESRVASNLIGTPQQVIDKIGAFIDAGGRGFVVWFCDYPRTESLELFAREVIPAFR